MSILRITEFQRVYPKLWNKINEVRIQTGSNTLDKDYAEHLSIPIRMHDASLAESFLEKTIVNCFNPKEMLGFANLQKILNAVETEQNMQKWLDILYYPNNPRGLFSDRYNAELKIKKPKTNKREPGMAKVRNQIEGEIIVNVTQTVKGTEVITSPDVFFIAMGNDGFDYTGQINQKKLKYAWDNKGVIRGRKNASDEIVWRVVKEKYIVISDPDAITAQPTTTPSVQI